MGKRDRTTELLPGTLDMLILKTLSRGPMHGYGIAEHILRVSQSVLQVGEGSLYPALQRLLISGWVDAEWGISDNNRRARYYRLTVSGRRRLGQETDSFQQVIEAISRVMQSA